MTDLLIERGMTKRLVSLLNSQAQISFPFQVTDTQTTRKQRSCEGGRKFICAQPILGQTQWDPHPFTQSPRTGSGLQGYCHGTSPDL